MRRNGRFVSTRAQVLRPFIFVFATLVTLVALFYVVENWRGRRAWERCKADLIAQGERLEPSESAPAPIPPEQNFAETPVFRAIAYKSSTDAAVWAKFNNISGVHSYQPMGPDEVHRGNASEILAAFNEVEPELAELRAAAKRPFSRFTNSHANVFLADVPNLVVMRKLTQLLIIHASAELATGHSDRAFADLEVVRRLADALGGQSTLVSAMIRVAILGVVLHPLEQGLSTSAWSDRELLAFQNYFASIDLLTDFDAALRDGERNSVIQLVEDLPRRRLVDVFVGSSPGNWKDRLWEGITQWCPRGWYYQNAVNYTRTMDKLFAGYDVHDQRVFPERFAKTRAYADELQNSLSPFNYLAAVGVPNIAKAAQTMAQQQMYLREAAVVCALERYRRAHSEYPESLAALEPAFIEKLPRDVITGETLKYQRSDDGFRLYAVGWNGRDDGGARTSDRDQGDWVWPPGK